MVAELQEAMKDMQAKMTSMKDDLQETQEALGRRTERIMKVEDAIKEVIDIKDDFGDKLAARLAKIETEMEMTKGTQEHNIKNIIDVATKKFEELEGNLRDILTGAQTKFQEVDSNYNNLYQQAKVSFENLDQKISAGGGGMGRDKKTGFLPDKLMVPKKFSEDIGEWRKWKGEVSKYFDESREGIKAILDEIANKPFPITVDVLRDAGARHPHKIADLEQWKHLYRAIEKLTDGEAAKVVSTVNDENGFEAWRQLHLRFEPELQAQKNSVLLELHNMGAATTIEETKRKLVELRVRTAKAENILGMSVQDVQKKTALLQVLDPITKQHTAHMANDEFSSFYTKAMNFTNNASVGQATSGHAKALNEKEEEGGKEDAEGCGQCWEDNHGGGLNAMRNGNCHACGQYGHFQSECPSKGKGKGKDSHMQPKGKGKGPIECWICRGNHRRADCPQNTWNQGGKPKGGGKKGGSKGYGGSSYGPSPGKGGKGWVNSLQQGYSYEDQCGPWGQTEFFGSIKTIEPEMTPTRIAVKTETKIHNKFQELMNPEEDEEEIEDNIEDMWKAVVTKKTKKKMMRVTKWPRNQTSRPSTEEDIDDILSKEAVKYIKIKAEETGYGKIQAIRTVETEAINAISSDGCWEKLELAVDSGATESVIPSSTPECIPTQEGTASRRGVEYEVASGHFIPNEGEKKFEAMTEEGTNKRMIMQVCDVTQGLLSVSKVVKAGNSITFDEDGSYIQNKASGDVTWMRERGGMYMLTLWVRRPF
jgi:hypothetical protein